MVDRVRDICTKMEMYFLPSLSVVRKFALSPIQDALLVHKHVLGFLVVRFYSVFVDVRLAVLKVFFVRVTILSPKMLFSLPRVWLDVNLFAFCLVGPQNAHIVGFTETW